MAIEDMYSRIIAIENLHLAYKKARKGKRYRAEVAQFEYLREDNLLELQRALASEEYYPGEYQNFRIWDPKPRLISKVPFGDRVVHHAIMNIVEPVLERSLIQDTYACRCNKGTHKAADRAQEFVRKYAYVLKADIVQYFPSIDHEILLCMLQYKIRDEKVMHLLKKIIDSGAYILENEYRTVWFPGDDLFSPLERKRGMPIGNLTSQILANFYLNPLDQFVKRTLAIKGYVRYCDDFLVFADSTKELQELRHAIESKLQDLRLIVHPNKTAIHPCRRGVMFVGYRIYPHHRRLRRGNISRFRKRIRYYQYLEKQGKATRKQVMQAIGSWIAHASHANTYRLRERLFKEMSLAPEPYFCEDL